MYVVDLLLDTVHIAYI